LPEHLSRDGVRAGTDIVTTALAAVGYPSVGRRQGPAGHSPARRGPPLFQNGSFDVPLWSADSRPPVIVDAGRLPLKLTVSGNRSEPLKTKCRKPSKGVADDRLQAKHPDAPLPGYQCGSAHGCPAELDRKKPHWGGAQQSGP
jgi:hypothetical protein